MSALGSLVVKLALEYAEYTQGLNKSDQEALKFAQNAQKHFDKASAATSDFMSGLVAKAAGAVVAVVGVSAVIDKLTNSIDTLAKLDDMAQKTGASVENLSRLQKVASAFGKDFSEVDGILVKLSKGMATADDETNKVNKALKALGVSSKDAAGKLRDPSEVLVDAAKRLQGFEDGANKSALAVDLLGKQGADALPYLNDLAENVDKFTGASTAAARQASEFQDNMGRLKVRSEELYTSVASALLPSMTDLAGAFLDASQAGNGMADPAIREWADDLAVGLARVADVALLLPRLFGAIASSFTVVAADVEFASKLGGALTGKFSDLSAALDKRNKILEDANKKYDDLWNKPANQFEQAMLKRLAARSSGGMDANDFGDGTAGGPSGKKALTYTTGNQKAGKKDDFDALNKSLQERLALTEKEIALGRPLTESEKEIAKLVRSRTEGTVKLTDAEMVLLERGIKTLSLNEQLLARRGAEEKLEKERLATTEKQITAAYEGLQKMQDEVDNFGRLESAVTAANVAKLELYKTQLEVNEGTAEEIRTTEGLIEVGNRLAALQRSKESLEANKKNAEEWTKDWKKSFDEMSGWIGDSVQRGFEDSGKVVKSFIQSLKSAFARLVLTPIIAPINASYASYMNPNAPQAAGMAPGGPDSASSAIGVAQMASSVYKAISGGFEALSTSVADAVQVGMNVTGMSTNILQNGPVAQFAGQAASYAGGAYAGHALGNMISGDYSVGNHGQAVVNVGTAIGAVIAGPIGAAVGGAVGGFVNRLFGMKEKEVTSAGIRGTVGPGGVTGDSFSNWHQDGGWFRSDKNGTDSTALSADITTQFATGLKSIKDASSGFAAMLGLSADAIDGYSKDFNIVLTKDAAANEKAITDFFTGIGDEIAGKLVPHLEDFTKSGESASATLQRLAGDFQATDQVARLLSASAAEMFGAVGMESAAARSRLVELAGGAQALGAKAAAYAGAFLTEDEKMAPVLAAVATAMGQLGLASITTKEDFKAQVNSMIAGGALATESGAKLFSQLMDLSPAFAQAADYTEALRLATSEKAATDKAAAVTRGAEQHRLDIELMSALGDAEGALAATRKDALDTMLSDQARLTQQQIWVAEATSEAAAKAAEAASAVIEKMKSSSAGLLGDVDNAFSVLQRVMKSSTDVLSARISKEKALSDAIRSTLDGMKLPGADLANRASAQASIKAALAIAKASGVLPDAASTQKLLGIVSQDASGLFSTYEDYQRDFYMTQNDIASLGDVADSALSVDEQSLNALNDMLASSQEQIDLLKGIDTSGLTVANAMAGLGLALSDARANPYSGSTAAINSAYQSALGRAPDAAGLEYWRNAAANGNSIADIVASITGSAEAKARKVPGFAIGGDFAGGVRIVGERGPELEMTGPSRIMSNDVLMQRLRSPSDNNAVLVDAVDRLTREVEGLRAEARAVAGHTAGTARLLGGVIQDNALITRGDTA